MKVCSMMCAVLAALLPLSAVGAGVNTIPYAETFESQANGYDITMANGWSGSSAYVTNLSYMYGGTLPQPDPHTKVLSVDVGLDSGVTNTFAMAGGQEVWADFMAAVNQVQGTNGLAVDSLTQTAFAVNTNNQLVLYHGLQGGGVTWTEIPTTAISDQWVRVSVKMSYPLIDFTFFKTYFQMYVDGTVITNGAAYTSNDGAGSSGGSWFVIASGANDYMTNFVVAGKGYVDDLVVSTNEPNFGAGPQYTANGTPYAWLGTYGLSDDTSDDDGDGWMTWEEFVLGNNPTNADDFVIAEQFIQDGSNMLRWASSTAGATGPYTVSRSTDLVAGAWAPIAYPARTPPTNTWGEALLGYPAYYRVSATNIFE